MRSSFLHVCGKTECSHQGSDTSQTTSFHFFVAIEQKTLEDLNKCLQCLFCACCLGLSALSAFSKGTEEGGHVLGSGTCQCWHWDSCRHKRWHQSCFWYLVTHTAVDADYAEISSEILHMWLVQGWEQHSAPVSGFPVYTPELWEPPDIIPRGEVLRCHCL